MNDPLAYLHQATVHQLQEAAEDIEGRGGVVADFDYEEEPPEVEGGTMGRSEIVTKSPRVVTLELTYLLPE